VLADGNLTNSYFDGLGPNSLTGKVFYWNSCQVFNNPMKSSVLNTGVSKFIGGICNLLIGTSEEVFKCWNSKNLYQEPSPQTDNMCYWVTNCESTTNYPQPGCHGCGGPGTTFPAAGGSTDYTLTVNTTGQGTVSLSPSGGSYSPGTVVTLTAGPSSGWQFSSWSGDLTGSQNPATITMNSDKNVTATFSQTSSAPVANFTAGSTVINVGQSVTFTDTSSNGPTSWSWSFNGGTPTTSTVQNPTVTYNTEGTYTVTLTATNSIGSDTETKTNYITVQTGTTQYCSASGNSQKYEWIAGVQVGSLNNTSGASPYSDFTNQIANVTAGATVNVSLTPGFASSAYVEYWKIFVDYNKDGDFADAGEEVFGQSGSSTVSGNISVPAGAAGATRMRVVMRYNTAPAACGTFDFGEVEDYTINIQPVTVDPPVADFTANATVITTGQTVSFTDTSSNGPTSWSWSFPGGTPSGSTLQNPTVTYNTTGTFTVTLTATNSAGQDVEEKIGYIVVHPDIPNYCSAASGNWSYEWIARVQVQGQDSLDKSSAGSGYSDFTSNSVIILTSNRVNFTITPGFSSSSYNEYYSIWIDYNRDGDFADPGEQVYGGSGYSSVSGSFTVPVDAHMGPTRMRIIMQYNSAPSSCGTFTYGEVEDYSVEIR